MHLNQRVTRVYQRDEVKTNRSWERNNLTMVGDFKLYFQWYVHKMKQLHANCLNNRWGGQIPRKSHNTKTVSNIINEKTHT